VTTEVLRRVVLVHGVVAWACAVCLVLVVSGFVFFDEARGKLRFVSLVATLMSVAAFASGALLDLGYRVQLRQRLFVASRVLGWLFERKLHFSYGALVFSCLALAALFAAGRGAEDPVAARLRRVALAGYVASLLFALFACVVSTVVAARLRF